MLLPLALLALLAPQQLGPPDPPDVDSLRHHARRIEAVYERRIRQYAPLSESGGSSGRCHERVGRYCLFFDDADEPEDPIPPEHEAVVAARRAAVRALRRAFAAAPAEPEIAGSLIRYLVEDDRTAEAVSAARAHRSLAADSARGALLLGFALHHDGRIAAAEAEFRRALRALPEERRIRLEDLDVLLSARESEVYDGLDPAARARYTERLWALADPLYLIEGNGALTEHLARHVWTELLPGAPWVRGKVSWGDDLEELTLRYGVPVSRERIRGSFQRDDRFVERFDPAEVAVVPASLSDTASLLAPPPGEPGGLDPARPRSAHTPRALRLLIDVAHQAAVVPLGPDSVEVRVAAALPLDSVVAERPARLLAGLFLRSADSLAPAAAATADFAVEGDTAHWAGRVRVPNGRYVYSIELLEEESRLAGRARYLLSTPAMPSGDGSCGLSDIIVARPLGRGPTRGGADSAKPVPALTFAAGDTIGVAVEIGACAPLAGSRLRVALAIESAERAPAPIRAIRWVGRALGLVERERAPRLVWEQIFERPSEDAPEIAVDLVLEGLEPGLHALVLNVDGPAGRVERRRLIRIVSGRRRSGTRTRR
ncbi:MAG: hypothetical protein ACRELV_16005 [Longimicrobiales bacterium]